MDKDDEITVIGVDDGHVYIIGTIETGWSGSKIAALKFVQAGNKDSHLKEKIKCQKSQLSKNYPKPLTASTVVKYHLQISGFVTLKVYPRLTDKPQEVTGVNYNIPLNLPSKGTQDFTPLNGGKGGC